MHTMLYDGNDTDKIEQLSRKLYHHAIVQIIVCLLTREILQRERNGIQWYKYVVYKAHIRKIL